MSISLFPYVWLLQVLAGLLAVGVIARCWRSLPKASAVTGMIYAVILCVLAWSLGVAGVWGGTQWAGKDAGVAEHEIGMTLVLPNGRVVSSSQEVPLLKGWFNLAESGHSVTAMIASAHSAGAVAVLYAGDGVHGSYVEGVRELFGDLKPLDHHEQQAVCYQPNDVIGFRGARCVVRQTTLTIDVPVNQRLAASPSGTVAATTVVNGNAVILLGYAFTPSESSPAPEESCLLALAGGRACVTPTFLPADTQMTMMRLPSAYSDVLKEFGIPKVEESPAQCLDALEAELASPLPKDSWDGFPEVTSEASLSRFLDRSTSVWMRTPVVGLQIPQLSADSTTSGLPLIRSLVSTLKQNPIWIASCEQIRARFAALQKIEGSLSDDGREFELNQLSMLSRLSTYIVSPVAIRPTIVSIKTQDSWYLYRLNDRVARLVTNADSLQARINLNPGDSGIALFSREMRLFLVIALMLGGIAALIQSLAASAMMKVSPLPMGTALPVAALLFIWLWYSYQYSLSAGSGHSAVVASDTAERPLLLSEIPDEFFFEDRAEDQGADLAKRASDLKSKIPQAPEDLAVLKVASPAKPIFKYQQDGAVVLLNSLTARNFFYRKSANYSAAVAAWEDLLNKEKISHQIVDDDTLEATLQSNVRLLIVPDARFVPATEDLLASWMEKGGVVLFTDRLSDDEVPSPDRAVKTFSVLMKDAAVTSSAWSSVTYLGANLAIDGKHRILREAGQLSVVRGTPRGKGGLVFFGAHPGQGQARELSVSVVKNLTGQTMELSGSSECRALLAFEPYRLPPGDVVRFLSEAGSPPLALAIHSGSLPAMLSSYSAVKDRIVVVDDGNWQSRYLAAAIFADIFQTQLLFLNVNETSFSTKGPRGDYRAALFVSDATPQKVSAALKESCRGPNPRPVIVGPDFVLKHRDFLRRLARDKTIKLESPAEFSTARQSGTPRVVRMKSTVQDPLQFSEEVK